MGIVCLDPLPIRLTEMKTSIKWSDINAWTTFSVRKSTSRILLLGEIYKMWNLMSPKRDRMVSGAMTLRYRLFQKYTIDPSKYTHILISRWGRFMNRSVGHANLSDSVITDKIITIRLYLRAGTMKKYLLIRSLASLKMRLSVKANTELNNLRWWILLSCLYKSLRNQFHKIYKMLDSSLKWSKGLAKNFRYNFYKKM